MRLFGRRRIYTDCTDINESNIEQVLSESLRIHAVNAREIDYLRWYVRGRQPILNREKKVRKDICNKTVMNLAQECLDFKLGYIWGEPVGIVRRAGAAENDGVETFNSFLDEQSKADIDQDIANDFCIGGLGYRAIFPNMNRAEASPFVMAKLDPETTFCVYQNDAFKRKVLGVSFCVHFDGTVTYSAYTDTRRFELESSALGGGVALKSVSYNGIGIIPIVEYSAPDLSGPAFERALPLLDAINILSSNRLDDVGQFIQSILWLHNAQMDEEDIRKLDELLAVQTQSPGDGQQASLKYLSTPLDQTTVQSLQECLERHVYELSGIPGREQSSGGSTGTAAEMGEAGWKKIEFQAKRLEAAWKRAEREANLASVQAQMPTFSYRPGTFKWRGDLRVSAGYRLKIKLKDNTYASFLICESKTTFSGGGMVCEMECHGTDVEIRKSSMRNDLARLRGAKKLYNAR